MDQPSSARSAATEAARNCAYAAITALVLTALASGDTIGTRGALTSWWLASAAAAGDALWKRFGLHVAYTETARSAAYCALHAATATCLVLLGTIGVWGVILLAWLSAAATAGDAVWKRRVCAV